MERETESLVIGTWIGFLAAIIVMVIMGHIFLDGHREFDGYCHALKGEVESGVCVKDDKIIAREGDL